ncbi:hypothetical protein [Parasphingorhabdus pacifica]
MKDHTSDPNTEQITIWRNLLDSFGQLSAAWGAAAEAQQEADAGKGPAAHQLPESLVVSFSRAGMEVADALAGVATVLSHQSKQSDWFDETAEAMRAARDSWTQSHDAAAAQYDSEPSGSSDGSAGSSEANS